MRIVFAALPAYGHLYPLMPLATACMEAGHQVSVAAGPPFVGRLPAPTFRALDFEVTEGVVQKILSEPMPQPINPGDGPVRLFFDGFGEPMAERLTEEWGKNPPDLVVYESFAIGAARAACELDIPAICFAITQSPVPDLLHARAMITRKVVLNPLPLSWPGQAPTDAASVPIRPVAWGETDGAPDWLDGPRDRPLAYLTLGTIFGRSDVLADSARQLVSAGFDVVIGAGHHRKLSDLSDLPENVRVEGFLPQHRVLPKVDLVVHHGGTGTMLAALAAGVPQIVRPQAADQFLNAARLAETGVGRSVVAEPPPGTPRAPGSENVVGTDVDFAHAARAHLDGRCAAAIRRISSEIALMPEPASIAKRIDALIA